MKHSKAEEELGCQEVEKHREEEKRQKNDEEASRIVDSIPTKLDSPSASPFSDQEQKKIAIQVERALESLLTLPPLVSPLPPSGDEDSED